MVNARTRAILSSLGLGLALACGGDGAGGGSAPTTPPPVTPPRIASLLIGPGPRMLVVGGTVALSAIAVDSAGRTLGGRTVRWTSSAPSIATIADDGMVTGVSVGAVDVTAASEGVTATTSVVVAWALGTIDVASAAPRPKSMVGLLNGIDVSGRTAPPDSLFTALRPTIWRSIPKVVAPSLAARAGALYELVLSDFWDYPLNQWPNGKPYERTNAYLAMMRQTVQAFAGVAAVWEVWNEPDPAFGTGFWDGTELQFFQTYLAAYRVIRSVLGPSAIVAGPSLSRYDPGYIKRFADFCVANGCEANVLTWHELGADRPLSAIAQHARQIRRDFIDDPAYARLGARAIHINESVGPRETYNPTAALMYLQYLELGEVDAAARACWRDASGTSTCYDNSLGGLVTPLTAQPRAIWWAYKAYADGASGRVRSETTDGRMLSLASRAPTSTSDEVQVQVLTGYADVTDATLPAQTTLALRVTRLDALPALAGWSRVRATVREVPNSGEAPLVAPAMVSSRDLDVVGGATEVVIGAAKVNAMYIVTLQPAR